MSALLRALMGQQVGGDDKPNLAVIKDVTFDIDSQSTGSGYIETRTGLTGVVKAQLPYRFILDYEIDLTYTDDSSWVSFGNKSHWISQGGYVALMPKKNVYLGKNTGHIDVVVDGGKWDYGAGDTGFIRLYHRRCKGVAHLYNFRIEEV